ncbi:MAG: hypothetical protein ACO1TE_06195 [Prosthecobacter sp.]
MKHLLMAACLVLANGAKANDLAKVFEHQIEAVFADSPVVVEGWIKRMDGKRGRIEFRWSTQDKSLIQELRDFVVKMKLTNYENPVQGGSSSALYLQISSAMRKGKDEHYIYVTFSGAGSRAVSASHDPEEDYFDDLARLVYRMYAQDAKIKVIQ